MYIYIIYRYISISTMTYSDKDLPGRRAAIGASCAVWDNDGTIEGRQWRMQPESRYTAVTSGLSQFEASLALPQL